MKRERRTIEYMTALYCRDHHGAGTVLCPECSDLMAYALMRLDKCPYREDKPVCAKCPSHCYKPLMRERVRAVMRYSGPRMLLRHPLLAVFHLIDAGKKVKGINCKS